MTLLRQLQDFHSIGLKAQQAAQKAVRNGELPRLDGTIECVDCGEPAKHYDHRDYTKTVYIPDKARGQFPRQGPASDCALWAINPWVYTWQTGVTVRNG